MTKSLWQQIKNALWEFQAGPNPKAKAFSKKKEPASKGPAFIPIFQPQKAPPAPRQRVYETVPKKFKENKLLQPSVLPKEDIPKQKPKVPKGKPKKDQPADWENKGKANWNEVLNDPALRIEEIVKKPAKRNKLFYPSQIGEKQRHLLFMNPGEIPIKNAILAYINGSEMPAWTTPFAEHLSFKEGSLYFGGKRMLLPAEKRAKVKKLYFDPREPSTIVPITDALRDRYPNVSKTNVTQILRSLEVYQLNFARRKPQAVTGKMNMKNPGVIACDTFYPSKELGWWGKRVCLTMMDVWSRYTKVYAMENKKKVLVKEAMEDFLTLFASLGHIPQRMICDKGSELLVGKEVMEKYRQHKDGVKPMVYNSVTGQPVLVVEALQAQIQRRMQVFRTAKLTDDPAEILDDISYQINHQKRTDRGNLSPIQLLSLSPAQRITVNNLYQDRTVMTPHSLKPLQVGDTVRVLLWDRKKQMDAKVKGFSPKWSVEKYTVLRKTAVKANTDIFRYHLGLPQSYYRHELLKIPKKTDTSVPEGAFRKKFSLVSESPVSEDEYIPSEDSE